ncbi:hypothetical protein SD71_05630 [Cohnella kolymensis]|uniref:DUF1294 domain-containing protein n=1 Tax=Cohnella kolymensis TaxID=1590652 RepID=A0ABR5A7D1_9BACL|nr:DUF1294 domain-containing protein [Cohnella kolymensis]KIL36875.1 hypothetical protein SD71_05630 [Cohnella kolymensis]
MRFYIGYAVVINAIAMFMMAHDKSQARKGGRRVRERTLFILSVIGGAIGTLLGMRIWRHKTKHRSFVIGIPLILVLQCICLYWLLIAV